MVKNYFKTLVILSLLSMYFSVAHAQTEKWQKELSGNLTWQQVTTYGNYFVCTNNELASYDPETGDKIWSIPQFGNITQYQLSELSGSPLVSISQESEISLIDPYSGEIKFNSAKSGISDISDQSVLYKANGILIAGKNTEGKPGIFMIDMVSGDTKWKIEEKFGRIVTINELSEKEVLIVTLFKIYKINSISGEIIWKSATSKEAEQLENMGSFGSLLQGMAEQAVSDVDFVINFYQHPSKDIFIIAAENKSESQSSSGQPIIKYSNNYSAFNINDGSRLWNDPIEMNGQLGDLAFYKEGIIILPNDGNRTKINLFDLKSAEGQWGKKGRGLTIKGGIYSHVKTEKGILLVSNSGDKNYLNFLNPETGLITFDKPVRIDGEVIRTIESEKGLLYITTEEINILNINTGELVLEKSIQTQPMLVQQTDNELFVFDIKDEIIKIIDIHNASVKNLTTEELRFEGKESPAKLELREKGIFISSQQNTAMYDYSGNKLFQKYFEAPREPGLKRALLYAQAARAAYISANSYYAAGVLQSSAPEAKQQDAVGGAIVEGLGMAYEELGNAATDFAKKSFEQANARFKATAEGRDFIIILSKEDKDNALLKVNKDTGEVEATINLGQEKDPKYAVDDVTGQIFKKTGANKITSYNL